MTAPSIAAAAGLWQDRSNQDRGTKVRDLITTWYEAMLRPGRVLVSGPSGYWHTADPDEISHYDRSLTSRIREIAIRNRRLRCAAKTAGLIHHGRGRWSCPDTAI